MPNTGSFALLIASQIRKLPPTMIQIPRYEPKPVASRIKIEQKILAVAQQAVVVRHDYLASQKTRELVKVDEIADFTRELRVRRMGFETSQSYQPATLFWLKPGFGVVDSFICFPTVTEILEQFI